MRNYVLVVNSKEKRIEQIYESGIESDKNIPDISKKVGRKFVDLGREYAVCRGSDFNILAIRAKTLVEAKLQLSFSSGQPYHSGWDTADRHSL